MLVTSHAHIRLSLACRRRQGRSLARHSNVYVEIADYIERLLIWWRFSAAWHYDCDAYFLACRRLRHSIHASAPTPHTISRRTFWPPLPFPRQKVSLHIVKAYHIFFSCFASFRFSFSWPSRRIAFWYRAHFATARHSFLQCSLSLQSGE